MRDLAHRPIRDTQPATDPPLVVGEQAQ